MIERIIRTTALLVAFSITVGLAQSSKELALMGKETWSGFECSALASKVGDSKEQERLFLFGYKQGQKFLNALRLEKIKREDLSNTVPIGVMMLLEGPSDEFILGRIFENALDEGLKDIFKTAEHFNSNEEQKTLAESKFSRLNCRLIGK